MRSKYLLVLIMVFFTTMIQAQSTNVKIIDALTGEPLSGASIKTNGIVTLTAADGSVKLPATANEIQVSFIGYETITLKRKDVHSFVALKKSNSLMQEVVVTANRIVQQRKEAPIAISTISKEVIEETKAQRIDQLLNKVSGVHMVSLGNEQHEMSIRQPMTTKSLFLYMEDGIPIRTTGVYNHNALLEMNMAAAKSIEVIKGPSSALYGSEAIGGAVNIITQASPSLLTAKLSLQSNNTGYKRADFQVGNTFGKWGFLVSGYDADKRNGPIEYSDFQKKSVSIRTDYKPNDNTSWVNTLTYVDYYSDMSGSVDSLKYAQRNYSSMNTFTFRKVNALRFKSMLDHQWNSNAQTNVSLMYRDNSIGQNPSYSIGSTTVATKFKGQINENAFKTFALFVNHTQKMHWLNSRLVAGASVDVSPQDYYAKYISITKDLTLNKYVSYTAPAVDSFLSKYKTGIINLASYVNYELSPAKNLRVVTALRYDAFQYYFINNLPTSSSVSTASTLNTFSRVTPKIGLTYNIKGIGFYTNFSQGYVPPQLTELYSSVKVAPYLLPQVFTNIEMGGWFSLLKNKIYADFSLYQMKGTNEIISVKFPDNTTGNQNAGSTMHKGIEFGLNVKPNQEWYVRFSGTTARHTFIRNIVKGVDFSGKEMSGAPRFTNSAEVMYKPSWLKGFRIGMEWIHQGKYFMDDFNKFTYPGYDLTHVRVGYQIKNVELWLNVLNAGNTYYSTFSSKNATSSGSSAYSFNLGEPRELTLGVAYKFIKK